MTELTLSIYTGSEGGNTVTMTAKFSTHEEAVRFHEGVSRLCQSGTEKSHWPMKLISRQD